MVLDRVISLSIIENIEAGFGKINDNNIIQFANSIAIKLKCWHYLNNSNDFSKKGFILLQIINLRKVIFLQNAPIFANPVQTINLLFCIIYPSI